jgi:hypothetical protein
VGRTNGRPIGGLLVVPARLDTLFLPGILMVRSNGRSDEGLVAVPVRLDTLLLQPQSIVKPSAAKEFVMAASLYQAPSLEDEDLIQVLHGDESMGHFDDRPAPGDPA